MSFFSRYIKVYIVYTVLDNVIIIKALQLTNFEWNEIFHGLVFFVCLLGFGYIVCVIEIFFFPQCLDIY